MGGVTRTPGPVWRIVFLLMTVLSLAAAVPVWLNESQTLPPPPTQPPPPSPATPDPSNTTSPLLTIFPPQSPPTTTSRPHCWDPEECCVHPFDSEKFDRCCEEHGCCPIQCPVTLPGGGMPPTKGCDAWECCVHREGSPMHQECCKRHGCCPVCERVSSGCCYNGISYAFRTIVLDMPEVCLQLVCAAKLLPDIPFFVATIAPVKTCSFTDMSDVCVGSPIHQCVDEMGLVRQEGDKWAPKQCTQCECLFGRVICKTLLVDCRPPPHPGCVAMPGPCCPVYHCDDGCIDDSGVFRPLGSQWPSADPCQMFQCTETGVDTVVIACKPSQRPHEGCHLQPVEGQCCPEWNCSRCLDTDGTFHPLNDVWHSAPCVVKECRERGVVVRDVACPPLGPPPHYTCYKGTVEGGCCEEWKCDGCWDNGVLHPPGDVWPSDDPCVNNVCTGQGAVLRPIDCPDFPKPHESCFEFTPEGECCPTWNCSGCLDFDGNFHPQFEEWQTDPCTIHVCHLDGITTKAVTCPPLGPAPHYTCHMAPTEDGCCKEWKCSGCFDDDGLFRPLGAEWVSKDNPCKTMRCTQSGIASFLITCDPTPPPHEGCFLQSVEGRCCKRWNCSGCVDDDGTFHPLFHEWKSNPCTTHICTESGIQIAHMSCLPPPRPHESCKLISIPGVCCRVWDCKYGRSYLGCHDDGQYYEDGSVWTTDDPCEKRRCMSGTVVTERVSCSMMKPPTANCFKEDQIGECCPSWNCSGCLDNDGVFHKLYEEWRPTPCITNSCLESGISYEIVDCPEDHPRPGCRPVTDPDECCPHWECSGCVDQQGNPRQEKDEWPSSDPCLVFRCVGSEVEPHLIQCNKTLPPMPICFPSMEEDSCCPTWNCSGCLDEAGLLHLVGESWTSHPCVTHTCTSQGVIASAVDCLGPPRPGCVPELPLPDQCCPQWRCDDIPDCAAVLCEAPPLDQDCKSYTPPGQCCPVFDCKPNCAAVLCEGPPTGKDCVPYTPPGRCCPVYNCRPLNMPDCSTVRCQGPPPGQDCKPYTPPGHCCPMYHCTPIKPPEIECAAVLCIAPPPGQSCTAHTPPGDCCPLFDCQPITVPHYERNEDGGDFPYND